MKVLPRNTIITGDARRALADLLPESVDTCITSPPYVGALRDYGRAGQLGQEPTVAEYVENLRAILGQVRRLLKPTGSLWLNLGDAHSRLPRQGAPAKGLLLAPQRVALALAEDGWLVRNVAIWHKTNPMPQSAGDRLSPTYEVVIFATKEPSYFFDLDAIRIRTARPSESASPHRRVSAASTRATTTGWASSALRARSATHAARTPATSGRWPRPLTGSATRPPSRSP